ncbi:hypothetical protein LOK49_LG07G02135 [Camellia lanceoleosa]|uniref:Uncharacterized protein n=1 Tax=Camellia lanceoleosa TaxID=1840588 RepID=A0ACC0GYM8_9ERIC|nr:hypothetical protein LOK49_LG07G02135 [Camellia lanceoleosa]
MANHVIFLAVFLLVSSSGSAMAESWDDPKCADVAWYFLPCMNFLQGLEPNPSPGCCDQLDKINEIAEHNHNGKYEVCQCIQDLIADTGAILASRGDALSSKCGVRPDFHIGGDCSVD